MGTCLDPVWALEHRPFQRLQDGVQTITVLCPSQEEPRPGLEVVKDQLPVHSEAGGFGKYAKMTKLLKRSFYQNFASYLFAPYGVKNFTGSGKLSSLKKCQYL